ncbi:LysR family transcriptional regulator [Paracoccus sp. Z118]|uniref:LysR family transcriptional regulator n=1 Tax=Paracoccus sp. Z118 TaxID=2851017 RepID=UPI001C2C92BB|nr:LysR family transcriptional regulator [Paracoccus sp. Z118]MBV0892580.1 LysR family transcriptional regulator [Paracoccus sp. Z118]
MIRLDALTLKQLRAMAAIADSRSLTGAAAQLGLTIPAVHAQLAGLETALGGSAFDRAEGFAPSDEGMILLAAARRIEVALGRASAEIEALRRGEMGRVTLGVVSTGKYFAPSLVRALMDAVPGAGIALKIGNRESTIEGLASGALDLAIMGRPPREPVVEAVPLGPHPHGIVLPRGHRLDGRREITAEDLADETFICREAGSGTRILMTRYLDRIGEGAEYQTVEMDSNETIKQAVIAGLGIAFLSLHTAVEELRSGRLRLLNAPGLPIQRTWYLVNLQRDRPSPLAQRLAGEIAARASDLLAHLESDLATAGGPLESG